MQCFPFLFLIRKNNTRSRVKHNKTSDSVEAFPCVHAHSPKVNCRSDFLSILPESIVCVCASVALGNLILLVGVWFS